MECVNQEIEAYLQVFVSHQQDDWVTQEEAKAALKQAADDMKRYYDQNCQVAPEYRVGDKAWLSLQNYSDHPMKKLDHKWAGPFTITKVVSPAAIKLHLST